jgi:hypothetical protein
MSFDLTGSYGQSTSGTNTTNIISAMAGLGLLFYAEDLAASRAHLKATYASGFTPVVLLLNDFSVEDFRPITQPTVGLAFSPRLANLLVVDVGYSLRPFFGSSSDALSNLQPLVGARAYFRDPVPFLVTGSPADIEVNGLNPGSTALYLGTEIEAGILARVFSDLGLSVRGAVFLPSDAFVSSRGMGFELKIEASASF